MTFYFISVIQEATIKKVTEEEEKFIKEITDFNNEYEITKKRELRMKENVKVEISGLENQANILKRGMKHSIASFVSINENKLLGISEFSRNLTSS